MRLRFGLKTLCVVITCVAIQISTKGVAQNAGTSEIASSQMIKPADMTPQELEYYKKVSDPEVARKFIITRSYVRLCQKVIDKKMPAEQLPDKPLGFSVSYLLPGEATLINRALGDSIVAMCKTNPKGCFGGK